MSHNRSNSRVARLLARVITMVMGTALVIFANPASAEEIYLPDGSHKFYDIGVQVDGTTHKALVYNLELFAVKLDGYDPTYGAWSFTLQPRTNAEMCIDPAAVSQMKATVTYGYETGSPVTGYLYVRTSASTGNLELAEKKVAEARVMLSEAKALFRQARAKFKQAESRLAYVKSRGLNTSVVQRAAFAKSKALKRMKAARSYRDLKVRKLAYELELLQSLQQSYAECAERRIN